MEKYVYTLVPVSEICFDPIFSCHFRLEDDRIDSSVRDMGIQVPLILTQEPDYKIVDGYKRALAAKKFELETVPAFVMKKTLSEIDTFLLALHTHWSCRWSDMDRIYVIHKALTEFRMSPPDIVEKILQPLGLKTQIQTYETYAELGKLSPALWLPIAEGKLTLQSAEKLTRYSKEDQKWIATDLIPSLSLTSAQMALIFEWLQEIIHETQKSLQDFFQKQDLLKLLTLDVPDKRKKTEDFMVEICRLRFPRITAVKDRFTKLSEEVNRAHKDIKLEAHPYFEEEGYTVKLKVRNSQSLNDLIPELEKRRTLLNSFFDFMI